jgi:invasion protein IalB
LIYAKLETSLEGNLMIKKKYYGAWTFIRLLAQVIFLITYAAPLTYSAHAEEAIRTKFGAWALRCAASGNATAEQCALTQNVPSDDKQNVSVGVMIRKNQQLKNGLLQVIAPIGVVLTEGIKFKIDQSDIAQLPFFRCLPDACIAEIIIDDNLLDKLETGRISVLTIYLNPGEGLRHLMMLDEFKKGYEALH